jgi:hypothetical protein
MGKLPRVRMMEERKKETLRKFNSTQLKLVANKELRKFLNTWIESNNLPAENEIQKQAIEMLEKIEITNFKYEQKLRKWNQALKGY